MTGTRCKEHKPQDLQPRVSSTQKGYDRRWRVFSEQYRKKHTVCCVVGCESPSRHVDHIDNLGPLGPRGYDPSNLQPLCHSHHSQKTMAVENEKRRQAELERQYPGGTT